MEKYADNAQIQLKIHLPPILFHEGALLLTVSWILHHMRTGAVKRVETDLAMIVQKDEINLAVQMSVAHLYQVISENFEMWWRDLHLRTNCTKKKVNDESKYGMRQVLLRLFVFEKERACS